MNPGSFESLSDAVQRLLRDARAAGAYERLVVRTQQTRPPDMLGVLAALSVDTLFARPVTRPDEARCALAGLWLYFDDLDRAHRIVQEIDTSGGSFWHAIMHRREGDFGNSKYWYARCREHPALHGNTDDEPCGFALVDLVAQVEHLPQSDARRQRAVAAQRSEWERLFDHCTRAATGGTATGGGA
jgi:hypothetical protein